MIHLDLLPFRSLMVWVLCETSLVLYPQTLEDTPEKWVSGQAVLCGNNPDVPVRNVPDRSHFPPGEEMERKTTWTVLVDCVIASVQAMQLWCSACEAGTGFGQFWVMSQRSPRKSVHTINVCSLPKLMLGVVPQGLFHNPVIFTAVLLHEGLSKGPSLQTQLEMSPQVTGGVTPQSPRVTIWQC